MSEAMISVSAVREIFTRCLNLHYDQRAYSWHEIQDTLDEVRKAASESTDYAEACAGALKHARSVLEFLAAEETRDGKRIVGYSHRVAAIERIDAALNRRTELCLHYSRKCAHTPHCLPGACSSAREAALVEMTRNAEELGLYDEPPKAENAVGTISSNIESALRWHADTPGISGELRSDLLQAAEEIEAMQRAAHSHADTFSAWARSPRGQQALRTIQSKDVSNNEAWLCLRAAFEAGANPVLSQVPKQEPTAEAFRAYLLDALDNMIEDANRDREPGRVIALRKVEAFILETEIDGSKWSPAQSTKQEAP